jgi:hypothetical protein
VSLPIEHKLETDLVAVVLASEVIAGNPPLNRARFGDVTAFDLEAPFLMATLNYVERTIEISLRDRRPILQGGTTTPAPTDSTPLPAGGIVIPKEAETPPTKEVESPFALTETGETFAPIEKGETTVTDQPRIITVEKDVVTTATNERTYRVRWWAVPASSDVAAGRVDVTK